MALRPQGSIDLRARSKPRTCACVHSNPLPPNVPGILVEVSALVQMLRSGCRSLALRRLLEPLGYVEFDRTVFRLEVLNRRREVQAQPLGRIMGKDDPLIEL